MISSFLRFISNCSTIAIFKSYLWDFQFCLAVCTAVICKSGGSEWNPPIPLIIFSLNDFFPCTNILISHPKSLLLSNCLRAAKCCKSIIPHTCRLYVAAACPLSDTGFFDAIPFLAVFYSFSTFFMPFSPPIEDKYWFVTLRLSLNSTLKIDACSHVSSIQNELVSTISLSVG